MVDHICGNTGVRTSCCSPLPTGTPANTTWHQHCFSQRWLGLGTNSCHSVPSSACRLPLQLLALPPVGLPVRLLARGAAVPNALAAPTQQEALSPLPTLPTLPLATASCFCLLATAATTAAVGNGDSSTCTGTRSASAAAAASGSWPAGCSISRGAIRGAWAASCAAAAAAAVAAAAAAAGKSGVGDGGGGGGVAGKGRGGTATALGLMLLPRSNCEALIPPARNLPLRRLSAAAAPSPSTAH
jgi:hypothetical protein